MGQQTLIKSSESDHALNVGGRSLPDTSSQIAMLLLLADDIMEHISSVCMWSKTGCTCCIRVSRYVQLDWAMKLAITKKELDCQVRATSFQHNFKLFVQAMAAKNRTLREC